MLYQILKRWYQLRNIDVSQCDLVVPLGYGLLTRSSLPDAELKVLKMAKQIAKKHQVPIAWASSNYFWDNCEGQENRLKAHLLGAKFNPIIGDGITNSITEAYSIQTKIIDKKIKSDTIVLVADWAHARSAKNIWSKIWPEAKITVISIDANWHQSSPVFFQRSRSRWLAVNLVRHIALKILGMRIKKIRHPLKNTHSR